MLLVFIRRWSTTLGRRSAKLAELYSGNILAGRLPGKRSFPSSSQSHASLTSIVPRPMNRRIPQPAVPKRRRNSYGREGSFVASDNDHGEFNHTRMIPLTKKMQVKRRVTANSQQQIKKRVDRIVIYAESYKGWSTGVVRHFNNWILEQELKSVSCSICFEDRP
jgi:hypothetical protein